MSATQNISARTPGSVGRISDSRIESIGWACFLILLGAIWLAPFPSERMLEAAFLIGVGVILLGINAARLLSGIQTRGFTTVLGVLTLACGLAALGGLYLPFWPSLLILIGAYIILRTLRQA